MIRLLIDSPSDGPTNMARDEALLTLVGRLTVPPTLRFYQWDPPAISLGYFQRHEDYEQLPAPAGDVPVVRRTTGGGAILHDREWTYSLTLPVDNALVHRHGPTGLYELVHDALIDTLALINIRAQRCGISDNSSAHRGPFFCFQRRHCLDVLIDGRKLAGSAQRRTPRAILQHGSIILANRYDQHPVTALCEYTYLEDEALLGPLTDALQQRLGQLLAPGQWQDQELQLAESLREKYADDNWTKKY